MVLGRAPRLRSVISTARILAPGHLPVECANALWRYVRAGEFDGREAVGMLADLLALRIELLPVARVAPAALEVALELDLTAYDAAYVVVAEAAEAPLVTADRRLAAAYVRSELIS
jgi:predicted nucleic acid-binding protein